jgi:Entner-Doudoroff aldolase
MNVDGPRGVLETIDATGVVAILRGDYGAGVTTIVDALAAGGVRAIEVSLTSPGALAAIARVAAHAPAGVVVGAGTVLTLDEAREAREHGATFLVSPVVDPEVIAAALELGLVPIPGAFTPTEVRAARRAGAPAVKLFPADALGPRFVKALLAPMPGVKLVPTGGVTLELARAFAEAGAWAVGVGAPLLGDLTADRGALVARARAFVGAMRPVDG